MLCALRAQYFCAALMKGLPKLRRKSTVDKINNLRSVRTADGISLMFRDKLKTKQTHRSVLIDIAIHHVCDCRFRFNFLRTVVTIAQPAE